jgi:hypothetical protein
MRGLHLSQGVQAALRSGVHAVAVVHTILSGGDADAAITFYREAVQAAAIRHRAVMAELYSRHKRWRDRPFWRTRAEHVSDRSIPSAPIQTMAPDPSFRLSLWSGIWSNGYRP